MAGQGAMVGHQCTSQSQTMSDSLCPSVLHIKHVENAALLLAHYMDSAFSGI